MILADTSVWINHFRTHSPKLAKLLEDQEIVIHPFIIGELACGGLENRKEIISLLHSLPGVLSADADELLFFIEKHKLMSQGLGLIDIHLLASCLLSNCKIWTEDKKLKKAAKQLNVN